MELYQHHHNNHLYNNTNDLSHNVCLIRTHRIFRQLPMLRICRLNILVFLNIYYHIFYLVNNNYNECKVFLSISRPAGAQAPAAIAGSISKEAGAAAREEKPNLRVISIPGSLGTEDYCLRLFYLSRMFYGFWLSSTAS